MPKQITQMKKTTRRWFWCFLVDGVCRLKRHPSNRSYCADFAFQPSMLIVPAPDEANTNKPPVTAMFLKNSS